MVSVGIFDSGIGGERFARELEREHPDYTITVVHDRKNLPYGNKTQHEIQEFTDIAIKPLLDCDVIVIACNTATAYAIDYLREQHPHKKFIGFEPAIKPAVDITKTKKIAVLATPATLKSQRYQKLKTKYADHIKIFEPYVGALAHQIENRAVQWGKLESLINNLTHQKVDVIILGCTHYHLIKNTIQHFAGDTVTIITPTTPVIRQIEHTLDLLK